MTRYRLRHGTALVQLPEGEFSIGRSSSCGLPIFDPLVSRHHAVVRVENHTVWVEDLQSRNGVYLNGVRITAPTTVTHLDRVGIGGQELVLLDVERVDNFGEEAKDTPLNNDFKDTLRMDVPRGGLEADDTTQQASGFQLVAGLAHKAIALGRHHEAQRILEPHLQAMLQTAEKGKPIESGRLEEATRYALRLASGLQDYRWVDWVFQLHAATRSLPQGDVIEELHAVVRVLSYAHAQPLRAYLAAIKPLQPSLSPPQRFLLKRLEGLERVVSA